MFHTLRRPELRTNWWSRLLPGAHRLFGRVPPPDKTAITGGEQAAHRLLKASVLVTARRHRQEAVRDVPELVTVVAKHQRVRSAGQHDELKFVASPGLVPGVHVLVSDTLRACTKDVDAHGTKPVG